MKVVVVDSNILLRHLLRDDPVQSPKASLSLSREIAQGQTLMIPMVVLAETLWVITRGHAISWQSAAFSLQQLLQTPQVTTDHPALALKTLAWMVAYDVPFTDAYLAALAEAQAGEVLTFDTRDFKKLPCRWRRP